jgi:hypothetical protein
MTTNIIAVVIVYLLLVELAIHVDLNVPAISGSQCRRLLVKDNCCDVILVELAIHVDVNVLLHVSLDVVGYVLPTVERILVVIIIYLLLLY